MPYEHPNLRLNKEWFIQGHRRNVLNRRAERTIYSPFEPEVFERRQYLGEGAEQVVYGFPEGTPFSGIVIKESKQVIRWRSALLSRLIMKDGSLTNILNWSEMAEGRQKDNETMVNILGPYVLPSTYIHGYASDGSGREANYCVQERIHGKDFLTVMRENKRRVLNDPEIRDKLLDIIWGSKKIFLEIGCPPDFYKGRNLLITDNKRIVLNDTGFPNFIAAVVNSEEIPALIRVYFIEIIEFYLNFANYLERLLQATPEEKATLENKYGLSDQDFRKKVTELKRKKRQLLVPDFLTRRRIN